MLRSQSIGRKTQIWSISDFLSFMAVFQNLATVTSNGFSQTTTHIPYCVYWSTHKFNQFVYGTLEEAEQKEKHNSKKDRSPVAEYNKVRESLLRVSTGLEGRNRGVENQQSNLKQCDYGDCGLISPQCHSTVHVKSQSIEHFPQIPGLHDEKVFCEIK